MRYIANSSGYLQEISFGAVINCNGKSCTEYTGGVPSGYSSLADWATKEADKLHCWQIVDGELTLDAEAAEPASKVTDVITVTTTGTDLNDYLTGGTWYFSSSYPPTNIPSGNNGWLVVMRRAATSRVLVKQLWFRQGVNDTSDHLTYIRTYDSNTGWSKWTQYATEKEAPTKTKLWTNANLSNSFNAQTISLDLADYDGVEILYYVDSSTNVYQNTGTILKGNTSVMWYVTAESGHRLHREFTVNANGVSFIKATNYSGSTAADKLLIPYIIYGIKGGQ